MAATDRQSLIAKDLADALTATSKFQRVLPHEEIAFGTLPSAMIRSDTFQVQQGRAAADPLSITDFTFIATIAVSGEVSKQQAQESLRELVEEAFNALTALADMPTSKGFATRVGSGQYLWSEDLKLHYCELTVTVRYAGAW